MKKFRLFYLFLAVLMVSAGQPYALEMGPVDVHGFLSQGYLLSSQNDYLAKTEKGSYEYNEAAVNFSTNLTDKLRLGLQLMSRDLGDAGNNQVQLDWAIADYRWRNELGIRVGKVKRPIGLYNESRDVDLLRTFVLLPQSVYDENIRDQVIATQGGGVYGTIEGGPAGSLEYQAIVGAAGNLDFTPTGMKNALAPLAQVFMLTGEVVDPGSVKATNIRNANYQLIWNTPLEGLRLGGSWVKDKAVAEFDEQAMLVAIPIYGNLVLPTGEYYPARKIEINTVIWVASGEYKWKGLTLAGELIDRQSKVDFNTPELAVLGDMRQRMRGYYGSLAYRFTDWFEAGGYYSVYYPDKHDRHGESATLAAQDLPDFKAWQKDSCLALRFDITPSWVLKLEGHRIRGAAQVFDYSDPDELRKNWRLYGAKASYSF